MHRNPNIRVSIDPHTMSPVIITDKVFYRIDDQKEYGPTSWSIWIIGPIDQVWVFLNGCQGQVDFNPSIGIANWKKITFHDVRDVIMLKLRYDLVEDFWLRSVA